MFSNELSPEITIIKREIDAQQYLLSMTDKYKIPQNEVQQTKNNLSFWENKLKEEMGSAGK